MVKLVRIVVLFSVIASTVTAVAAESPRRGNRWIAPIEAVKIRATVILKRLLPITPTEEITPPKP